MRRRRKKKYKFSSKIDNINTTTTNDNNNNDDNMINRTYLVKQCLSIHSYPLYNSGHSIPYVSQIRKVK